MAKIYIGNWVLNRCYPLNVGDELELIERPEKDITKKRFEEAFNQMYEYELTSRHPHYFYKITKVINPESPI